jgi:hypothetical protein
VLDLRIKSRSDPAHIAFHFPALDALQIVE